MKIMVLLMTMIIMPFLIYKATQIKWIYEKIQGNKMFDIST